ncbi:MAG TPA: HAD family hydrolase [Candidatus Saccharimonadales bacterium]|nr:HAD family hydrolase [Candidatus Saccharimonadales bacterium]
MIPERPPYTLACLDLAGTLVADESGEGGGLVGRAFAAALDAVGVTRDGTERDSMVDYINLTMGQSKGDVFAGLFPEPARAAAANAAFESVYGELTDRGAAVPIPGAVEAPASLRRSGIRICLVTGFSPATRDRLLASLGWADLADLALSPADAGRGRPYPDMILTAVLRLRVDDVSSVAVVGDTEADIRSGLRAGAGMVAGVLTGAGDRDTLARAGATHVLDSVADLEAVLVAT